jgi:hypothetical protein
MACNSRLRALATRPSYVIQDNSWVHVVKIVTSPVNGDGKRDLASLANLAIERGSHPIRA